MAKAARQLPNSDSSTPTSTGLDCGRSRQPTTARPPLETQSPGYALRESFKGPHKRLIYFHSTITALCDLLRTLLRSDHSLATRHIHGYHQQMSMLQPHILAKCFFLNYDCAAHLYGAGRRRLCRSAVARRGMIGESKAVGAPDAPSRGGGHGGRSSGPRTGVNSTSVMVVVVRQKLVRPKSSRSMSGPTKSRKDPF